jgi:hypothetical protein
MLTNNKKLILNGEYFSPLSYNNVPGTLFLIFYYYLFAMMEKRPPTWRVAVNKLNKQPWTANEGWSSSLGVGRGANNPSP